jgi:activator of HSP90 ATPase
MDARKHSEFTGAKATCDPTVGGKFTAWDGYISGRNLELQKGKRIVQEWITVEWPKGYSPSTLELTFRKAKGGTEVRMTHSQVPEEQADEYRQGWIDNYWDLLKAYFQKRRRSK